MAQLLTLSDARLTGERAEFFASNKKYVSCIFDDGESPLKHSSGIVCEDTVFGWKYPLWYSTAITVTGGRFEEMARAGIWYTKDISLKNVLYTAPKGFRRSSGITLENVSFENAQETLWQCENVKMKNIKAKGDYFAMNCEKMDIDGLDLDGNYSFDGAKNVHIKNSRLLSKDAFWNSENITAENCFISGEYLGWNAKNLTLINCTIESLQGLCYIENLFMRECKTSATTLAFEYSTVDAEISGAVESVKNPLCGRIKADRINELILEPERVDVDKTQIIIG